MLTFIRTSADELKPFIDGSFNDPSSLLSKEQWSAEHNVIYERIMARLSEVVTVKESGRRGAADLAMSRWVDPTRVIVVVPKTEKGKSRAVVEAAHEAIREYEPEYAILIDDYPTQVCVRRNGSVLGISEASDELSLFGFPPS